MKQVIQNIKSGELGVADVPAPAVRPGGVLVRTRASLISAGTEKMLIDLGRKSLVGKAKARPDLVKKVIDKVKTEGFMNTLRSVMGRLHSSLPLGYSAAGEVIGVGEGLEGRFRVGDRVACAGAGYANHAEFLFVPANLVVPMPDGLSWREGACVTLGAIALQGVRVADLRLGETVGVIGLGLLGQITVQLLRASGCRVAAIDLDPGKIERARGFGAEAGGVPGVDDLEAMAQAMTGGHGLDAVIVTAATSSSDPVVLAGKLLRKKGRVSVVGAVGMDVPRAEYYLKELDLRLSCSYGPGRYDPAYEERGHDYPYAYVRWTENRNMDAFLRLAAAGDLDLGSIVTHEFGIEEAQRAYDLIDQGEAGGFLGILLTYPEDAAERAPDSVVEIRPPAPKSGEVGVGVIGAGNFAKAVLLPALRATPGASLRAVATASGLSARDVATRFGASKAASDPSELFDDPTIDAVMVLTRHDSHAELVARALRAGKAVFVEKPLAIDAAGLDEVEAAHAARPGIVQVGFNRRFAPLAATVKRHLDGTSGPRLVTYRVNGGAIPRESWIQDPKEGGGRIIGEGCHFVDLMSWLIGGNPDRVFAEAVADDTLVATLRYPGGHVGSLVYVATGDGSMSKERVEAFAGGRAAILEDWREAILHSGGRERRVKQTQDKGFRAELAEFVSAVKKGGPSPIPFADAAHTTRVTFAILEALRTGEPQLVSVR